MASKKQVSAIPRAIIFLALAIFFFIMAGRLDDTRHRTMLYCFAGLDAVWGIALLLISRRNSKH